MLIVLKKELGLEDSASQQEIINKIRQLLKKPDSDYNTIKAERDRLQSENKLLKEGNTKLISKMKDLDNLGIKVTDDEKSKVIKAASIENVEEIRNNIVRNNFEKLKNDSDFNQIIQEIKNLCNKLVSQESEKADEQIEQQALIEQPTK